MPGVEEKVKSLEELTREIAASHIKFQKETRESLDRLSYEMAEFKDEMREFKTATRESLDRLSREMAEFKDEMKVFKDEMREFKDEMAEFKDEMLKFREESQQEQRRMNRQWGELANSMGTVVEDIVAPNIPRILREYFNCDEDSIIDFSVRRKIQNKKKPKKKREFDVIAICDDKFLVNETKSTPRIDYINDFIKVLSEIEEYFPESKGKTVIPIFSSLYMGEDVINYLTKNHIYALGMNDDTMEILNPELIDRS